MSGGTGLSAFDAQLAGAGVTRRDGVYYLTDPAPFAAKEDGYWRLRSHEGRVYPDDVVRELPRVPAGHPQAAEWALRADSLGRLRRYLGRTPRPRAVLDLGCGNGWMAHHLAALPSLDVYGMDLNRRELTQAARVFHDEPRLKLLYGDVFEAKLPAHAFNAIILASVIQYFADLPALVRRLLALLAPGGAIHVVDSPLYTPAGVPAARERSRAYYSGQGFPDVATDYHHHTMESLAPFRPVTLYRPRSWRSRVLRRLGVPRSPFTWIRIDG